VYGLYYTLNNTATSGFIRDLNFSTTISPELATMITIGSTANGYVVGEDATALSRMNNGLEDRFKKLLQLQKNLLMKPKPLQKILRKRL
jgi:hypothetical protein